MFGTDWKIINILGEPRAGGPFALPLFSSHPKGMAVAVAGDPRVAEAGRDYGEGWYTADQSRVDRVIHPQWSKKCVQVTQAGGFFLESWGAEKMSRWTASAEHQAERQGIGLEQVRVSVLDQDRDIAVVKVAWDIDSQGQTGSIDISRWPKWMTGGERSPFSGKTIDPTVMTSSAKPRRPVGFFDALVAPDPEETRAACADWFGRQLRAARSGSIVDVA